MYHSIIMVGGISLFNANNLFGKRTRELNLFTFDKTNPKVPKEIEADDAINEWINEVEYLINQTKENPEAISAEYSMVYALHKHNKSDCLQTTS